MQSFVVNGKLVVDHFGFLLEQEVDSIQRLYSDFHRSATRTTDGDLRVMVSAFVGEQSRLMISISGWVKPIRQGICLFDRPVNQSHG